MGTQVEIATVKGIGSTWRLESVRQAPMVAECGATAIGPRVLLTVRDQDGDNGAVIALAIADAERLAEAIRGEAESAKAGKRGGD